MLELIECHSCSSHSRQYIRPTWMSIARQMLFAPWLRYYSAGSPIQRAVIVGKKEIAQRNDFRPFVSFARSEFLLCSTLTFMPFRMSFASLQSKDHLMNGLSNHSRVVCFEKYTEQRRLAYCSSPAAKPATSFAHNEGKQTDTTANGFPHSRRFASLQNISDCQPNARSTTMNPPSKSVYKHHAPLPQATKNHRSLTPAHQPNHHTHHHNRTPKPTPHAQNAQPNPNPPLRPPLHRKILPPRHQPRNPKTPRNIPRPSSPLPPPPSRIDRPNCRRTRCARGRRIKASMEEHEQRSRSAVCKIQNHRQCPFEE